MVLTMYRVIDSNNVQGVDLLLTLSKNVKYKSSQPEGYTEFTA